MWVASTSPRRCSLTTCGKASPPFLEPAGKVYNAQAIFAAGYTRDITFYGGRQARPEQQAVCRCFTQSADPARVTG